MPVLVFSPLGYNRSQPKFLVLELAWVVQVSLSISTSWLQCSHNKSFTIIISSVLCSCLIQKGSFRRKPCLLQRSTNSRQFASLHSKITSYLSSTLKSNPTHYCDTLKILGFNYKTKLVKYILFTLAVRETHLLGYKVQTTFQGIGNLNFTITIIDFNTSSTRKGGRKIKKICEIHRTSQSQNVAEILSQISAYRQVRYVDKIFIF